VINERCCVSVNGDNISDNVKLSVVLAGLWIISFYWVGILYEPAFNKVFFVKIGTIQVQDELDIFGAFSDSLKSFKHILH